MARQGNAVNSGSFVDIHTKPELKATDYLPEDMKKNWESIFTNRSKNSECNYFETKAYVAAKKHLWYCGWVTLCGYPGDGKSCMAEHLVCNFVRGPWSYPKKESSYSRDRYNNTEAIEKHKYKKESLDEEGRPCYTPVFVKTPQDYKVKVNPNKEQIVVIDDIFGKAALDWSLVEAWRPLLEELLWDITTTRPKTLVIVCVNKEHLSIAPGEITGLEWFRQSVMIDFQTTHKFVDDKEKENVARANGYYSLNSGDVETSGITHATQSAGLLYRMRNQVKKLANQARDLFQSPWPHCHEVIDKVYKFDKIMYYTMSVCVVLDGRLDLSKHSMDQYDPHTRNVMEQLIILLDAPQHVDLAKMRYAAKKMTGFFFHPTGNWIWRISHPRVHQLCALSLCKQGVAKVIELLSVDFIMDYVRIAPSKKSYFDNRDKEMVVEIEKEGFEALAIVYITQIMSGQMKIFISNDSCASEDFVGKWFEKMRETDTVLAVVQQKDSVLQRSLFYWACYYGQGPVVKAILESPESSTFKEEGWFKNELEWGLQAACANNGKSSGLAVKCLLDQGVSIATREKYEGEDAVVIFGKEMVYLMHQNASPLHIAALRGHPDSVKYLLEKGANVSDKVQDDGRTPLHRAAMRMDDNAKDMVKLLLEKGASYDVKSFRERTPLHEAAIVGNVETTEVLVTAGASLDEGCVPDGRSFMLLAAQNRNKEMVDFLIRKKVSPNGRFSSDMFSPLITAVHNNDENIVNSLVWNKVNTDNLGGNGWSALHLAVYLGLEDIVRTLVMYKANVNQEAYDKKTPLHIAAMKGNYDMVELLLEQGAKTNLMTSSRETPVVLAAKNKHEMIVWLLIKEGMELEGGGIDLGMHLCRNFMFN